jgi:4-amino-4-deoxy-L-arabinose transferase-like glycosyltransferase
MTETRLLWLIFAAALLIRLAYTLGLYAAMGVEAFLIEDSPLYLDLAHNFVTQGDFVRFSAADGGFRPETERMPLYVIWLALHQWLSGTTVPLFPALTQGAVDAFACVLIARAAMLLEPRLLLPAGLIAACNPTQFIVGAMILTDSLFFFFVCLMLYAAMRWLRDPAWRWALLLGLALGLGVSTRVMLLPAVVALAVLLPLILLWWRRFRFVSLAHVAVFVAICAALQAPIWARNISLYGSAQLTSQAGAHTLLWLAPAVLEAADGTPHTQGARIMQQRYEAEIGGPQSDNPFERSAQMSGAAWRAIGELGAGATIKAWVTGAAITLFSPAVILSPPVSDLPRTGFFDMPGDSKWQKITAFLFRNDNPAYGWVLLLGFLALLAVRTAQLAGLVRGLTVRANREASILLALLALWTLYILLINGPIASPKYRLPIEPFAVICGAYALLWARDLFTRRAARRQAG